MKVIYCGTGYVGLTSAAVTAHFGHEVVGFDIDQRKIADISSGQKERLNRHVNEPGLYDLISKHLNKTLHFTADLGSALDEDTDVIFLCLPSPYDPAVGVDLRAYHQASEMLIKTLQAHQHQRFLLFINKSTVPIGTNARLRQSLQQAGLQDCDVVSNPEFLVEGKAVEMSLRPDRVVVGARDQRAFQIMRQLYAQFQNHPSIAYLETTPETAEAIKYIANSFLFTKIVFWQATAGRLCEKNADIDFSSLRKGVCSDKRINSWGSFVSNGAGGSCFKKDILALIRQMQEHSIDTTFIENVNKINEYQKAYLIDRACRELQVNFNNRTVAVLGLAFKKDTNDMRESSALTIIDLLLGKGVKALHLYDPLALENAKTYFDPARNHLYNQLRYKTTLEEALQGTDGLIICTDWEEFRRLGNLITQTVQPPYFIIDGRRMLYNPERLVAQGYSYLPVAGVAQPGQLNP